MTSAYEVKIEVNRCDGEKVGDQLAVTTKTPITNAVLYVFEPPAGAGDPSRPFDMALVAQLLRQTFGPILVDQAAKGMEEADAGS